MPHYNPSTAKVDLKVAPINFSAEQIRNIFLDCDTDGNKVLSKEEIKLAFDRLGAHIPAYRAWRALKHADFNNDGCISMEELNDLVGYACKLGYKIKENNYMHV